MNSLAFPAQIVGVVSAILAWMVVVPILDLLQQQEPEAEVIDLMQRRDSEAEAAILDLSKKATPKRRRSAG